MRTPTRSPTRCASPSRHYANASANPGSSPPSPASDTASTPSQTPGPKEGTVDRAFDLRMPRLSLARVSPLRLLHLPSRTVRLRLTLLYGGLFLVSGVALLAATYLLFRSNTGVDVIVPRTPHGSISRGALNGVRQMYARAAERDT